MKTITIPLPDHLLPPGAETASITLEVDTVNSAIVRDAKAEAWDEGWNASYAYEWHVHRKGTGADDPPPNPYHVDAIEAEASP